MTSSTWPIVHFGEIAEFRNGLNFTKENFGKGIKVIGVSDFQDYIIPRYDELVEINPEGVVKNEDFLKEGDILFVRSNGNRNLIGRNLFLKGVNERIAHSGFTIRARLTSKNADPRFYAYLFRSSLIRETMSAQGSGTNINNLNQGILNDIRVPFPPIPTQQKIAAILSAYDDLIENNTRRIKIIEEMDQAIYREWFVNFRFPGHEGVRMVESELGLVPEGWVVKKLKEICSSINYGFTTKAVDEAVGPKFLRITDIVPNQINWDSVPYCEVNTNDFLKYQLSEGDIVIARTGATSGYGKRINKNHPRAIFASYLVRLKINKEISNHYIGLIVESEEYKKFIKTNLSGSAQPQANAQVLTSIPVIIPQKDLLLEFESRMSKINDMKELLQMKNANLRRTRDLLLPKLISGEIDVSELDIKIPEANA